jgi:uncharacterized small protein (DUF1192 family)
MDIDDLEPQKQAKPKKDLEVMSIEALHEYIEELQAEIERARGAISQKQAARQGAEAFFKK